MQPADVADLFAVALLGATAVLVALAVRPRTRAALADASLALAAFVALGATLGSLYFSERAGFVPCEMCWYQRIAMYPLVPLLGLAAFRAEDAIRRYGMVLAGLGLAISVYHVQLQLFPDQSSACDPTNPCSGKWVEALGFMTIPWMAGLSFLLIIGLLALPRFAHPASPHRLDDLAADLTDEDVDKDKDEDKDEEEEEEERAGTNLVGTERHPLTPASPGTDRGARP